MNVDLSSTGLSQETIQEIQRCFLNFPEIEKAVLYGSRAKGNYRKGSDIDLSLIGKNLTPDILFSIEDQLDDLWLPYSFDLSIYQKVESDNLLEHIDRVGIVFFQKPPDSTAS